MAKPIQDVLNDVFDSGNNALKVSSTGGGGGTTITVTTEDVPALTYGTPVNITHPSVALGSGDIWFAGELTIPGSEDQEAAIDDDWSADSSWTRKSEQGSVTEFTTQGNNGSYATGSFDVAVESTVGVGTALMIGGSRVNIRAIAGDGTAENSVELSVGFGLGTLTVTEITNIQLGEYQAPAIANTNSTYVKDNWTWAYLSEDVSFDVSTIESLIYTSVEGSFPAGSTLKVAYSKDGGTTWYYHNGSSWLPMTLDSWASNGCIADSNYGQVKDATGTNISETDWNLLDLQGADHVRVAVGLLATTNDSTTISDNSLYYDENDAVYDLNHNPYTADPTYMMGAFLWIKRVNATTVQIINKDDMGGAMDIFFKIYTL